MGMGFDADRTAYLRDHLAPARLTRVVDVGANPLTASPYSGLLAMGGCEVWGFEPHPAAYEELQRSAGEHEHYLPYAVGSGAVGELRICKSSGFTSLLEPNQATMAALGRFEQAATVVSREPLETKRLDSMDEIPDFDLLKIDIQGGERDVFKSARVKLKSALAVITEAAGVHLYVDQPLLDEQMELLRRYGFSFHKFHSMKTVAFRGPFAERMHRRKFRSQFVDGDMVFVRSILEMDRHDDEALKHLAILSDAVFDSQDVTVAALTILVERGVFRANAVHGYLDFLPHVEPRTEEDTA